MPGSASEADQNVSPEGTIWALGTTEQLDQLTFAPFRSTIRTQNVVGENSFIAF